MIYLEDNHYLPDGIHDIVGKLQEIIVKDNNIEDICKNIIKNEFMNEVNRWGCNFEDILDESVGMGETYAEALGCGDWNCTKYYVHFDEDNNARLFKVLNIEEDTTDDIFDIKNNNDGTYDFHVKFEVDEDDLCCLSGAIDRCVLEKRRRK